MSNKSNIKKYHVRIYHRKYNKSLLRSFYKFDNTLTAFVRYIVSTQRTNYSKEFANICELRKESINIL